MLKLSENFKTNDHPICQAGKSDDCSIDRLLGSHADKESSVEEESE